MTKSEIKPKLRYFLLLSFLLLSYTGLFAQQQRSAHSYGVKSGLTLGYLSNTESPNINPGFQVGAFAKFGGLQTLFFKTEFLITQKGNRNWDSEDPFNFNLFYVDVPIMFGIDILTNLSFNLGIQPSVLIGGNNKSNNAEGITESRSVGGTLSRFDYSTLFGVEYMIDENWLLGLRYNYSFVAIQEYNKEFTDRNNGELLSNRLFQLYVGYVF